jgi:8-oxo-dGTP pyrophosphatase MutT (NUDIX family)
MRQIRRVHEVIAYKSSRGTLFDDEVVGPTGERSQYLRWQWTCPGVVIIPRRGDRLGLCRAFRYPIGRESVEFPRGMLEPGENTVVGAARELREETGLVPISLSVLGHIYPDTGLQEHVNHVFEAEVGERGKQETEPIEAIDRELIWWRVAELHDAARRGEITCGTTLSAFALFLAVHEERDSD